MKKQLLALPILGFAMSTMAAPPQGVQKAWCADMKSGYIVDKFGGLVEPGFNELGYNYQARLFNGGYCDIYNNAGWCQDYTHVNVRMKWNDAWLSNTDCDFDGELDRHRGYEDYVGSGAWITNHFEYRYTDGDGSEQHATYFTKIVAVPANAVVHIINDEEVWMVPDQHDPETLVPRGIKIWGQFAKTLEIVNDTGTGESGVQLRFDFGPGFGRVANY